MNAMTYTMPPQRTPSRVGLLFVGLLAIVLWNAQSVETLKAPLVSGMPLVERCVEATSMLGDAARCHIVHGAGTITLRASLDHTGSIRVCVRAIADDARAAARLAHAAAITVKAARDELTVVTPRLLEPGVVVDVDVTLPEGIPLDVDTVGGRTTAVGVGPLTLRSQSGTVELEGPTAQYDVETGTGCVDIELRRGPRPAGRVRTVTGVVSVAAQFHGNVGRGATTYPLQIEARSLRGHVDGSKGTDGGPVLKVESLDGDIHVREI